MKDEIIYSGEHSLDVIATKFYDESLNVIGHTYGVVSPTFINRITFQKGRVDKMGSNGATNESLLAILIHRTMHLETLNPCDENKKAIERMQEAMKCFEDRQKRLA